MKLYAEKMKKVGYPEYFHQFGFMTQKGMFGAYSWLLDTQSTCLAVEALGKPTVLCSIRKAGGVCKDCPEPPPSVKL